jgi:hypothetical protein
MKESDFWSLLRYEFLQFTRIERNKGLLVYLIGLPFISYVVVWPTNSSDSALGIGILSIFAVNILYGPVQFFIDQRYYEGLFIKNFDFADLIRSKLLFLQIVNTITFVMLTPLLLLFFDFSRFLFAASVFLYCIGIASPASIFLSGINFRFIVNSFSKKYKLNYFKVWNILFGLIPFIPGCLLVMMFSSNFVLLFLLNIVFVFISLLFNHRICRIASHIILNRKFFC